MSGLKANLVPLSVHFNQAVEAKKTRLELLGRVDPAAFATFYAADHGAYQQIMHGYVADPNNTASIRLVEKAGFKYTNRNVPSSFGGHDDPTLYREYMRPKI